MSEEAAATKAATTESTTTEAAAPTTVLGGMSSEGTTDAEASKSQDSTNSEDVQKQEDGGETTSDENKEEVTTEETAGEITYDFTIPEGVDMNEESLDAFKAFASDRKFSQEDAQALVDYQADLAKATTQQQQETFDGWKAETNKLGAEKLGDAKAALDRFGGDAAKELFANNAIGDHPAITGLLANIGAALREGKSIEGSGPQAASNSLAAMYPTMHK